MLAVLDGLDASYLGCFVFGLLVAAASHLLAAFHVQSHFHHPLSHGSVVHGGPLHVHQAAPWRTVLAPGPTLAFVSWFGGVGYQARRLIEPAPPASLALAAIGGAAGAAIVWWVMDRIVRPNDRALDPADFRVAGLTARVSSGIRSGGVGEIVYELQGTRWVSAARADRDGPVPRGRMVVIRDSERGVAVVEPVVGGLPSS